MASIVSQLNRLRADEQQLQDAWRLLSQDASLSLGRLAVEAAIEETHKRMAPLQEAYGRQLRKFARGLYSCATPPVYHDHWTAEMWCSWIDDHGAWTGSGVDIGGSIIVPSHGGA